MLLQLCLLFVFLALGEVIVYFTGVPVPSSIIGMVLLFLALVLKVVKLRQIEQICDVLTNNLGFFFIPAGIGVMRCFGLISAQWLPIVMSLVVSTALIMLATGTTFRLFNKKRFGMFKGTM